MRIRKKIQSYSALCVCARARACVWCNRVIKVVVIQSGNQPCHRPFSAFHAKKVKEALRAILSGIKLLKKNICFIKKTHLVKTHLKSAGFSLLWKLVNMAIFIPVIFYLKTASNLLRLENSFQHSSAEKSSWKHRLSLKLK